MEQGAEQIDGEWEDDGGVLLGTDGVQGLQVAQLDGLWRFRNYVRRLLQRPRGFLLPLRHDHLILCENSYKLAKFQLLTVKMAPIYLLLTAFFNLRHF
jgi:hypothetical protein